jgi:hypothetical protein
MYQSYLLRLWKDNEEGDWRAVLLSIPTQERRHFSSLRALFDFLDTQAEPNLDYPHPTALGSIKIE